MVPLNLDGRDGVDGALARLETVIGALNDVLGELHGHGFECRVGSDQGMRHRDGWPVPVEVQIAKVCRGD